MRYMHTTIIKDTESVVNKSIEITDLNNYEPSIESTISSGNGRSSYPFIGAEGRGEVFVTGGREL